MRKFFTVTVLAALVGVGLSTAAIRLRAARVQWRVPADEKTKHVHQPGEPDTVPVFDPDSITFAPTLEVRGEVLAGGRVRVHARADLDAKPRAVPELYTWKIAFVRILGPEKSETVWSWDYARPLPVVPGTHTTPSIEETVGMPRGEYVVQVSLVPSRWEETEEGSRLIPADDPRGPLSSCLVRVP